jgi:hypothetical protein
MNEDQDFKEFSGNITIEKKAVNKNTLGSNELMYLSLSKIFFQCYTDNSSRRLENKQEQFILAVSYHLIPAAVIYHFQ